MSSFLIFDGNSILNRAFYGVRPLNTKDGFPTNALFGFVNILRKHLSDGFTHAAIAYDLPAPTFRHKACDTYKGTRKGMPEDLAKQLPVSKEIATALGLAVLECEGFEADDILGTVSRIAADNGSQCVIVTGDRDSYQLVNDKVTVRLTALNETKIITPAALSELYGLAPSQLIDLKAIMGDSSDNIKGVAGIGEKGALALIREYKSLDGVYEHIDDIKGSVKLKLNEHKEDAYLSRFLAEIVKNAPVPENPDAYILKPRDDAALYKLFTGLEFSNILASLQIEKPLNEAKVHESVRVDPSEVASLPDIKLYITIGEASGCLSVSVFDGEILRECPLDDISATLFGSQRTAPLVFWSVKDTARAVYDAGYDFGCDVSRCVDVSLMAYIVSQTEGGLTPEKAAVTYLGTGSFDSLCALLPEFEAALLPLLDETGESAVSLYRDIELPLSLQLARIEHRGFYVDSEGLKSYGEYLGSQIRAAENEIYFRAGHEFNINSPKQLGVVLFDELGLPHYQKTQNGYSTSAEVLDKLAPYHPIIDSILFYRKMAKLKSTYCDGLLAAISPSDGRVHTTFRQTLTKTGRLSSTEPNLQNIPVRTEEGKELRKYFIAGDGNVLIDADYSQIELRVLAHISGDDAMISAFISGKDIHSSTAARVFGVPEQEVTSEMRKRAKAVNFGIVYGISDYSLGQDIGITKKQAAAYIDGYLSTYPKIRAYLQNVKAEAKENGYVTTLYGRRRYIPELRSSKKANIAFGERVAMNTPIQGTAADIIKLAMTRAEKALAENKLDAHIILQVHDELIVEASEADAEKAREVLVDAMENACRLSVPLTVDAGTGKSWYDAKD